MARILYLEDQLWVVENTVITFIRKGMGHDVTVAQSKSEARAFLEAGQFDLLILDIMLVIDGAMEPSESALSLVESLGNGEFASAGNPASLPVVLASGVWDIPIRNEPGTTAEDLARKIGIPAERFLRKPFLPDEVRQVVAAALEGGR